MISDDCEDELARLSWAEGVSAPVDADGKLVPLRTEKLYTDWGELICVDDITLRFSMKKQLWDVFGRREHQNRYCAFNLSKLHLHKPDSWVHKPDSWERLEEDARKSPCDYFGHACQCEECPANNRSFHSCNVSKALDIVRRAKAIAGVSDVD